MCVRLRILQGFYNVLWPSVRSLVLRSFIIIQRHVSAGHPGKHVYVGSYYRIIPCCIGLNRRTVVSSAITYVATLANYLES